jgi:hypothetical protein
MIIPRLYSLILPLSLLLSLSGCQDSLNRAVSTLFNNKPANGAYADDPLRQKSGAEAERELTPARMARIEAAVRKSGKVPAAAVFSDWTVGPAQGDLNSRVGAVVVDTGKKRGGRRQCEIWRFLLEPDGKLSVAFVSRFDAPPAGQGFVPESPDPDSGVEGDELAQREAHERAKKRGQQ